MQALSAAYQSYQSLQESFVDYEKPFLKVAAATSAVVFLSSCFLGNYMYLDGAVSKISLGNVLRAYSALSFATAVLGLSLLQEGANPLQESVEQLDQLQRQLEEKEQMVRDLKTRCEDLQVSLTQTEENLQRTQEELAKTGNQYQQSLSGFESSTELFGQGLEDFGKQLESIRMLASEVKTQESTWDKDQEGLSRKIQEIECLTHSIQAYGKGFVKNIEEYKGCLEGYRSEREQIHQQNLSLEKQNQALSEQLNSLQGSLDSWKSHFAQGAALSSTTECLQEEAFERKDSLLERHQEQVEQFQSLQSSCDEFISFASARQQESKLIRYLDQFFRKLEAWKKEGFPPAFEEKLNRLLESLVELRESQEAARSPQEVLLL